MRRKLPNFTFEKKLWDEGYLVVGIDEVGRGALAGPITVGGVCMGHAPARQGLPVEKLGIDDSKRLSSAKRNFLAEQIKLVCQYYSTASVDTATINRLGIVSAFKIAVRKVIKQICSQYYRLNNKNIYVLIDGFKVKNIINIGLKKQDNIIRGDQKSISIAAASIIAKVERDQNMIKLDQLYPIYHWRSNKGYGTRKHIDAIKRFGKTELHRNLFLRKILGG